MHRPRILSRIVVFLAVLSLPIALAATSGPAGAASARTASVSGVTSSSLGDYSPTFTGPAATGCATAGCALLSGPYRTPSTESLALGGNGTDKTAASGTDTATGTDKATPAATAPSASGVRARAAAAAMLARDLRRPVRASNSADSAPPAVSCDPVGPGCDVVGSGGGGATGVTGLTTVDSARITPTLTPPDIEPPDQSLCAGNGYVVEANNIGEILIFSTALHRLSQVIPFDTLMGLTSRGWSSGGDISCLYDASNGGHWFFTEFASADSEASGGAFTGCFAAVAGACYEGIAVTQGNDPFGPYNVYFAHADYNPAEPGYPYFLNDFAKIATTRDAFLLFYDEFPLNSSVPGFGGGGFNGAQEFAFNKTALERGWPVTEPDGAPNPRFTVAIENMGLLPTPDGTCASTAGIACWYAAIPAQAPDPSQWDNSHGGSGFMLDTLDYYGQGDDRLAVFDWTGLSGLDNGDLGGIRFGGQLFSGTESYYDPSPLAAQKAGPIPLGDECGAAGLSTGTPPPASCPEGGVETNGDFMTQVSQAQGQLWGGTVTEVNQTFGSAPSEVHQGVAYWVVDTGSFDRTGVFGLTSQGYVSAAHEDLAMSAIGAEGYRSQDGGNGGAIMTFTLTGNDYYPSTAFGRLSAASGGLLGSVIHVADLGQSPQDGFSEYQGYPGATSPRWGDYSWAVYYAGRVYFANEYIPYPSCTGSAFTLTVGTCGGTRDGYANWGTSVNSVQP